MAALVFAGATLRAQVAGLWIGQIAIDHVAEVADGPEGEPTPVADPVFMTILLHVDGAGAVRLLKEVWLVRTRDASPVLALVVNPAALSDYDGITQRGESLVGQRWSSAFFPFAGSAPLGLTGNLAHEATITGTISLAATDPLNPYRHKFHPDHAVGVTIGRDITLTVDATSADDPPGTGTNRFTGNYAENITGLHKIALKTTGRFELVRISTIPSLVN